jgi:hypothetical protein
MTNLGGRDQSYAMDPDGSDEAKVSPGSDDERDAVRGCAP